MKCNKCGYLYSGVEERANCPKCGENFGFLEEEKLSNKSKAAVGAVVGAISLGLSTQSVSATCKDFNDYNDDVIPIEDNNSHNFFSEESTDFFGDFSKDDFVDIHNSFPPICSFFVCVNYFLTMIERKTPSVI